MRTVKIREFSAKVLRAAAQEKEPLAITKDNVVCGIVIPVSPRWVQDVVHQNLSRIVNSIQMGEKEVDSGEPFVTLEEVVSQTRQEPSSPPLRRVRIGEMSGKTICDAAESGEPFAITSDNVLQGVLIPVSQRWLEEVVDSNLSRVVRSIRLGERELAVGTPFTTLDDVVGTPAAVATAAVPSA